jgi:hypothetical protein
MSTVLYNGNGIFSVLIPGEQEYRTVRDINIYAYRCDHCRHGAMAQDPTLPVPATPRGNGVHGCSHEAVVAAWAQRGYDEERVAQALFTSC